MQQEHVDRIASSTVTKDSTREWRDRKRYLWLIGLVVPSLAFVGFGGWQLTGSGLWFWVGPVVILGDRPRDRPGRRPRPVQPARRRDRGAGERQATTAGSPTCSCRSSTSASSALCGCSRGATRSAVTPSAAWEKVGLAVSIGCIGGIGINTAHELGHKKESPRAVAVQDRPGARWSTATSTSSTTAATTSGWPPRRTRPAPGWARASTSSGRARSWARCGSAWRIEKRRYARKKRHPFRIGNDVLNAWLMTAVLWGGLVAWLGVEVAPYLADPGGRRLLAARGRQLHGALRDAPPEGRRGRAAALRAGRPQPQLELQQHRDQRAALPPAAAQRPPRQPHPALPGAARLRGEPGAADRVRRDDRARDRARRSGAG